MVHGQGRLAHNPTHFAQGQGLVGCDVEYAGDVVVDAVEERLDHILLVDDLHHGIKAHQTGRQRPAKEAGHGRAGRWSDDVGKA